jgi:hypothetical protein
MATIQIIDLNNAGTDLLLDSESYLNELTEEELNFTHGGSSGFCITVGAFTAAYLISYVWGRWGPR